MLVRIQEIEETVQQRSFSAAVDDLNALVRLGSVVEYEFRETVNVDVQYYRAAADLFFDGRATVQVRGVCARCAEPFDFTLETPLSLVVVPRPAGPADPDEVDYYEGEWLDLAPLVHERLLLALPTRALCSEECRGLCPVCGENRNLVDCGCRQSFADPRLAVLRNWKARRS